MTTVANAAQAATQPDANEEEPTVLRFKLKRCSIPVELEVEDPADPSKLEVQKFVLTELDGEQRDAYLDNLGPRMKINDQGVSLGIQDFKGLEAFLVSLGLRYWDGSVVPEALIQRWPARIRGALHDWLKKNSALDAEAEKRAKNSSKAKS